MTTRPAPHRWRLALAAATLALAIGLEGCNAFNGCLPLTEGTSPGADRIGVGLDLNEADVVNEAEVAFTFLEQAGITWARVAFPWAVIQPQRETFDWHLPDTVVAAATRHGVRLHVVLKDTAPWASVAPFVSSSSRGIYPPANYEDWFRFALLCGARYKETVRDWEIWEGIDHRRHWAGQPEQYMRLLGLAAKALRSTSPRSRILMGGLTQASDRNIQFLDRCLSDRANPLGANTDAVSLWPGPVSAGELRERLFAVRRGLKRLDLDKPIVVSGVGWSSERASQGACDAYGGGESGQARFAREALPWLVSLGASRVVWQHLWDGPQGSSYASFGVVDRQLQAKAALGTLAGLVNPQRIGQPASGSDSPITPPSAPAASDGISGP